MYSPTSTTRSPERRRPRLFRAAGIAMGALSIVGLALTGAATSASATTNSPATGTTAADHGQPGDWQRPGDWRPGQRGGICLRISSFGDGRDSDCGHDIRVQVRRGINSIEAESRHGEICVSARARFGRGDTDCEDHGWARVRVRGGATFIGLRVEHAEICMRARVGFRWTHERCGDEGEWVHVGSRFGQITGLSVDIEDDDDDDDDDDHDFDDVHGFKDKPIW